MAARGACADAESFKKRLREGLRELGYVEEHWCDYSMMEGDRACGS
jgi:hypothetical protein